MNEETWEDRYKRAVARFAGVPEEIVLSDIQITVTGEDGYKYSNWTFADPNIEVWINYPGGFRYISGPEAVADLIRSFFTGF